MNLNKNDTIKLEITAISNEGSGIGRYSGLVVFVPMTAIGDIVEAKIVKILKTHVFAIISKILKPSPQRIQNDCPVFSRCGGCSLRHISYPAELSVKSGWVGDNLKRIGGADIALDAPSPSPMISRYRNKAQYPVRRIGGEIRAGFFAKRSHALIPVGDCLLQPEFFADITDEIIRFLENHNIEPYDEITGSGILRHIFIRHAEATCETMVCLVANASGLPFAETLAESLHSRCSSVKTVLTNENTEKTNVVFGKNTHVIPGPGYITDNLSGVNVRLSAKSFYQVNRAAAEKLYAAALKYLEPSGGETLLDLYCGAGTIGLSMAGRVKEVIGVEAVAEAVADAKLTAVLNGVKNARFIKADAAVIAGSFANEGLRPDIIIVDPPRKGLDESLPLQIAKLSPEKLAYISCDSATLSRDIKKFTELGYSLKKAMAVDLFPRTAHVESAVLMSKIK